MLCPLFSFPFFFFNDPAPTEIYTLSLHDALPICYQSAAASAQAAAAQPTQPGPDGLTVDERQTAARSEEHTSELQSRQYLVCRLLLEKKKNFIKNYLSYIYILGEKKRR